MWITHVETVYSFGYSQFMLTYQGFYRETYVFETAYTLFSDDGSHSECFQVVDKLVKLCITTTVFYPYSQENPAFPVNNSVNAVEKPCGKGSIQRPLSEKQVSF